MVEQGVSMHADSHLQMNVIETKNFVFGSKLGFHICEKMFDYDSNLRLVLYRNVQVKQLKSSTVVRKIL